MQNKLTNLFIFTPVKIEQTRMNDNDILLDSSKTELMNACSYTVSSLIK